MPDLNPAFEQQGGTPLTVLFGYGNGSGNAKLVVTDPYNNQFSFNMLFDGECDGWEQYSPTSIGPLVTPSTTRIVVKVGVYFLQQLIHFHTGRWTPIGAPITQSSVGPENAVDQWFIEIPTVTPPQSFSGICHAVFNLPFPSVKGRGATVTVPPIGPYGIFRGARCRYFDANGNVTGYGFTTNPTWHMLEVKLRYKFKRQQPQNAGLTDAEKAIFNWPAIVAHAARNDFVLANGWPRFMGNYVFAAQATLASMLETMLRCCRSYIDDPDGKIGFYGYDATNSGFLLTGNHIIPGSFRAEQKDLTKAPNVFVPKYRDLNIAALIACTGMFINNSGNSAGATVVPSGTWEAYFQTGGVNPFVAQADVMYYGDSSNPAMHGDYLVNYDPDPTVPIPGIWCTCPSSMDTAASATGGYIGTQTSRFGQRAPTTVQHRRHQQATGAPAPGVAAQPNIVSVEYDMANMTYDQANRIMQWMCNTQLGIDQPGWTAPITGSMTVRLDAVDANGNAFIKMRPKEGDRGDGCGFGRFTIDDTVDDPSFAGEYIITKMKINPPTKSASGDAALGTIEIEFISFVGEAGYPDVSATPDDSLRTIASAALPQLGKSNNILNCAWLIQATPSSSGSGSSITVTIPDLTLQLLGHVGYTTPVAASWPGLTAGTSYLLYADYPSGGTPSFGSIAGATQLPGGSPSYRIKIMVGTFNGTTDFTPSSTLTVALGTE